MRHETRSDKFRFALFVGLLAGCFLMGGASRVDVTSLIILQPFAVLCTVGFLLAPGERDWRPVRVPLVLLGALAAVIAAQLVPLPPSIWTALPGHFAFAATADVADLPQPWRPISLTPDLTLATLVGLVVPAAVLIGFASIGHNRRQAVVVPVLAGTALSALFALGQVSGGEDSPFYLYRVTNHGHGVGLFSNRNHQAVLIAMALPLLATWARFADGTRERRAAVHGIAIGFALLLLPLLLVTGSRAGLVLGVIGLAAAAIIWRTSAGHADHDAPKRWSLALGGVAILVVAATVMLSRAEAVQRMLAMEAGEDERLQAAPVLMRMAYDFFPLGSGWGSFDPIFRYYEPAEMLNPQYLNHAHNDVLELVITGGLPAMALAILFLAWFAKQSLFAWRSARSGADAALAQAGSIVIALALLSSVVDYPLRTPLMMAVFAIACGWLGQSRAIVRHPDAA